MQSRGLGKIIQSKTEEEAQKKEIDLGHIERKPEHIQEIQIRNNKPVQRWYLEQYKDLYQYKQYKADGISQQIAH